MNTRLFYWLPVFIWLAVIFILSSIPSAELPRMPSDLYLFWAHRAAHIGEYSVLGVLIIRAYSRGGIKISINTVLFLSIFVLFAGLFDEWHQSFVPGRHAQFIDAIFDTICGTTGMFVYFKWKKPRYK